MVAFWSVLLGACVVGVLLLRAQGASGAELTVVGDRLEVRILGRDALYAVRRRITVPVAAVRGVAVAPSRLVPRTGLRLPGTAVPGVLRAGSYGTGASRDFWLVRKAEQLLVVELQPGQPYRRLVLEVPDPHAEALRLRPVLGAYTGSF